MTEMAISPTIDDTTDGSPLYLRIQKILQERIAGGVYAVGSLMPTEAELAKEFDTSRFTIREALRHLTSLGVVERRQGVGTRVVSTRWHSTYVQSFNTLQELFQIALETYFVTHEINRVTLTAELAEIAGGQRGEEWFQLDGVRWTEPGGKPICYIQCYIPLRFAEVVPQFNSHQGPFFALLEKHAREPIEEVVQEIRSVAMPPKIGQVLGLRPNALALQLLRRYSTESGVLISSVNWHPAEQMKYVMRIHRRPQSAE
jgi:DNA-binding GntR family transcriptional regulator